MNSFILASAVIALVVACWYFWPKIRSFIYGDSYEPVENKTDPAPVVMRQHTRKPAAKVAKRPAKKAKKAKARRR